LFVPKPPELIAPFASPNCTADHYPFFFDFSTTA
jgi:hypothetical protein